MHKPIKFIYALLIITIVGSSVTWYLLREVKKKEVVMEATVIPEVKKQEKELPVVGSIEGTYVNSEDTHCKMQLRIYKGNDGYLYDLKTPEREIKNTLSLWVGRDNQTPITLEGIEWAEDSFDGAYYDDSQQYPLEDGHKKPTGIEAFLSSNEIIIQNYGNAMNYYTKLGECDNKYIRLIK